MPGAIFFLGGGGEQLFGTLGHASLICYTACKCPQFCNAKSVQHMCVGLQIGTAAWPLCVIIVGLQVGTAAWPLFVILVGLQIGTAAWPRWYYWPADWHCSLAIVYFLLSASRLALQLGHCLFLLSACRLALQLGRVGIVGLQIGTPAGPLFVTFVGRQSGTAAWPCWYCWPADFQCSLAIVVQ